MTPSQDPQDEMRKLCEELLRDNWHHKIHKLARYVLDRLEALTAACAREKQLQSAVDHANAGRMEWFEKYTALKDEAAELRETWVDETGMAWSPPTAWAYAKVCKARDQWRLRAEDCLGEKGKLTEDERVGLRLAENHMLNEDADELEEDEVHKICWALIKLYDRTSGRSTAPSKAGEPQARMCSLYNNDAIGVGAGCKGYHGRHDSQYGCRHDRCPMKQSPEKAGDE